MTLAWQLEWPCFFKTSLGDSDKMFAWKRLMLISNINTHLVKIKCSWTYFKQEVLPALLLAIKEKGNGDQKEWNKKVWRLSCNTTLSISQKEREGGKQREREICNSSQDFQQQKGNFPSLEFISHQGGSRSFVALDVCRCHAHASLHQCHPRGSAALRHDPLVISGGGREVKVDLKYRT